MRARGESACHQADLAPRDESRDHEAAQHQHPLGRLWVVRRDRESEVAFRRPRNEVPRYQRMIAAARSQVLMQAEPAGHQCVRTIEQLELQIADVRPTRSAGDYVVSRVELECNRIKERG